MAAHKARSGAALSVVTILIHILAFVSVGGFLLFSDDLSLLITDTARAEPVLEFWAALAFALYLIQVLVIPAYRNRRDGGRPDAPPPAPQSPPAPPSPPKAGEG